MKYETREYYDGERKKTMKELEIEKEEALSALYEWVKKLPKKKKLNHNSNAQ